MDSVTVLRYVVGSSPPGQLIAHDVTVNAPGAVVRAIAIRPEKTQAYRIVPVPFPVSPTLLRSPGSLQRQITDRRSVELLGMGRGASENAHANR